MKIIPSMLETVKDLPVKHYCGKYGWFNPSTGETGVFFCGLASCGRKYCQKLHYIKRVRLISDLIPEYDLWRFWTLTMGRNLPRKRAWTEFPGVWNKVRTVLVRKNPSMKYVAILEAHKDGYPHAHVFLNMYLDKFMVSRHMKNCGGGMYTYAEKIDQTSGDVAEYVSKQLNVARYVGKDQVITAKHMVKPRARTFWRSQGMKTEYEREKANKEKSGIVLVTEDLWRQTEEGFDKLHGVVYNRDMGMYLLIRKHLVERSASHGEET